MFKRIALLAFLACTGCETAINLYPVEGPYANQTPPVSLTGAIQEGLMRNSGTVSVTLPSGEQCNGKWSAVGGQQSSVSTATVLTQQGVTPVITGLSSGPALNRPGHAVVTCPSGQLIQMEFTLTGNTMSGVGVGQDNIGNTYRLVF